MKLSPSAKKQLLIHAVILAAGVAAVWYFPPNFVWWDIGYAFYFIVWLIRRILRDIPREWRWRRALFAVLLAFAFSPAFCIMLIPGWLVGAMYSNSHPDYARDLAEYRIRQNAPPLRRAAYYRDYNNWAFEGDIDQADLGKLAALRNWELEPIEKPVELWSGNTALGMIAWHEARKRGEKPAEPDFSRFIRIEQGLSCSTYPPGDDCGEIVVWDSDSRRLYVRGSLR